MNTNEMGYLETVVRNLREATDELKRDNDEAEQLEREKFLAMMDAHAKSYNEWVRWDARQRNARLGLPADHGFTYDDDRR